MNYITSLYNRLEINPANLSGAIDVVVVEQPDGTFNCSPFHVRFGKIGVLRSKEKEVDIEINGETVDIHMTLGKSGEAFFMEEIPYGKLSEPSIPPFLKGCVAEDSHSAENSNQIIATSEDSDPSRKEEDEDKEGNAGGRVVEGFEVEIFEPESGPKCEVIALNMDYTLNALDKLETSFEFSNGSVVRTREELIKQSADEDSQLSVKTSSLLLRNKRKRKKRSLMKKNSKTDTPRKIYTGQEIEKKEEGDSILYINELDQSISSISKTNYEKNGNNKKQAHDSENFKVTDIHFFSDSEATPSSGIYENSLHTQVKSDSEYETERHISKIEKCGLEEQSWAWGELPTSNEDKEQSHLSWVNRLFWFMKRSHVHQSHEGVYLSDLDVGKLEPDATKIYFPIKYNTAEETHPPSVVNMESEDSDNLLLEPFSNIKAVQVPSRGDLDSDFEESKILPSEVIMSLCGGLTVNTTPTEEAFYHHVITYDEFITNPTIVNDPNLVIRIGGDMYNWKVAGAIILSIFAFQRCLPKEAVSKLCAELTPRAVAVQRRPRRGCSWFQWGSRAAEQSGGSSQYQEHFSTHTDIKTDKNLSIVKANADKDEIVRTEVESFYEEVTSLEDSYHAPKSSNSVSNVIRSSKLQHSKILLSRKCLTTDRYRKTLRLTSEQISKLNLHDGVNDIEFSVTTALQGTTKCKCFLFKWRYDDKIVVSDIDGTITKSDFLGHFLPIVGRDWSQRGVTKLFTKIKDNGYKLLYLSSRAIGQSGKTRDYLKSLKQEDFLLPDGPMLLNPTGLISAVHTELIEKKPENFKISCLKDIQALFPPNRHPFYAGFGNKINDAWAYQSVGIPMVRTFTINHRGEIRNGMSQTFRSSFPSMTQIVNQMFPAIVHGENTVEEFSQFNYWRNSIPEIELSTI